MSSAPIPDREKVSSALRAFFDVEHRNAVTMANQARRVDEIPPAPTLGSAYDSLMQAPEDVVRGWFQAEDEAFPIMELVEFGELLGTWGPDAPLDGFVAADDAPAGTEFVFDVKAWATIAVHAETEQAARRVLRDLTLTGSCPGGDVRSVEPEDGVEPDLVSAD